MIKLVPLIYRVTFFSAEIINTLLSEEVVSH